MSVLDAVSDVLRMFADGEEKVGVSTLVQRLGWPKSNASRVLAQMAGHGLLERDPADRQYRLGALVARLGRAQQRGSRPLRAQLHQALVGLSERSGHTAHLSVLDGTDTVLLEHHAGPHPLQVMSPIGSRLPASVTAMGRALLSRLPDDEFQARYGTDPARALPAPSPRCPRSVGALAERVGAARRERSAIAIDEGLPGVAAAATTVHDPATRTTLGIALSFPSQLVPAPELQRHRDALVHLAGAIGRQFEDPWWV